MDSFVLLAYASFEVWRNLLERLLDLLCCYKQKKWFLWAMAAAQAAENHVDERCLTWYLWWERYTSISTGTNSQNSLAAAEALILKILSHGTSLKWSQRPFSTRIVISYLMKQFWVYSEVSWNRDNNMIKISEWGETHCRTNTSIKRKK